MITGKMGGQTAGALLERLEGGETVGGFEVLAALCPEAIVRPHGSWGWSVHWPGARQVEACPRLMDDERDLLRFLRRHFPDVEYSVHCLPQADDWESPGTRRRYEATVYVAGSEIEPWDDDGSFCGALCAALLCAKDNEFLPLPLTPDP